MDRTTPSISNSPPRYSYTVINNLLRTIRSGREIKIKVDEAISLCGDPYDLLDAIEDARQSAVDTNESNASLRLERTHRGIHALRTYYFLILFASFLHETKAVTFNEWRGINSYENWVKERPVFKTIERELDHIGVDGLIPLERPDKTGIALTDEIHDFVATRRGQILSAFTLLKSDYFVSSLQLSPQSGPDRNSRNRRVQFGLQKMSLPERVEGVPNFRRAPLLFSDDSGSTVISDSPSESLPFVYGTGMPTVDGLRRGLERMGGRTKRIIWTSMREEPVIFVSGGRPHVSHFAM